MTNPARWRESVLLLLGFLAFGLNAVSTCDGNLGWMSRIRSMNRMSSTWEGRNYRIAEDQLNLHREMVRRCVDKGEKLVLVVDDSQRLDSVERALGIVVAFEHLPGTIRFADMSQLATNETDWLLIPADIRSRFRDVLLEDEWEQYADVSNSYSLWHRANAEMMWKFSAKPDRTLRQTSRGLCGFLVVFGFLGICWSACGFSGMLQLTAIWILVSSGCLFWGAGPNLSSCVGCATLAVFVLLRHWFRWSVATFCSPGEAPGLCELSRLSKTIMWILFVGWSLFLILLTLSHSLSPPNGLGTFGGKAFLWYQHNGVPKGFWTQPSFTLFQPAYPPGLSMLALATTCLSKGSDEWLIQLVASVPFVLMCFRMLCRAHSFAEAIWIISLFMTGTALNMGSLFYAEGWMLLFLYEGIACVQQKILVQGWFLIGSAALFKNEGVLFVILVVACVGIGLNALGKKKTRIASVAMAFLPSVAWISLSHWFGASLQDYAPVWCPNWSRAFEAGRVIVKQSLLTPWSLAFVPYVSILQSCHNNNRIFSRTTGRVSTIFFWLSCIGFSWIYGISTADLKWHVWSSVSRLLWDAALLSMVIMSFQTKGTNTRLTVPRAPRGVRADSRS